ncbi:2'-5' RNA ligase family protein [Streptococcus sp. 20-1249]|uniref:2'-5' RNA ligase family protein n=1 Tax=Streptococcus hepaticus TaxID=3349163 RepID=UPI0037492E08
MSDYARQVQNRKPHVTLASYEIVDSQSEFIESLKQFCEQRSQFTVTLSSVGSFLQSGTVFFSPVLSGELQKLHAELYQQFKAWKTDNLYSPGKWIPHLTLANYLSVEKLPHAFALCQQYPTLSGQARGMQLIEIDKNKQVSVLYQGEFQK